MTRTTVSLAKWVPGLYARRDATGDWARVLAVLERVINDILSAPDTRAYLDCGTLGTGQFDTVLEAVSEGDATRDIRVRLDASGATTDFAAVSLSSKLVTLGVPNAGVTTVGDIEDALMALDESSRLVRIRTAGARSRALGVSDGFVATNLAGASPAGRVLGKISIDAMSGLRDPLSTEARLLPYLAQNFGWDLDTSLPERLQRKVLTLAEALFQEKGTKAGIVDALRLLLGLEVVYEEPWADGWTLDVDDLGEGTVLAPAASADGYAEGVLVVPAVGVLLDHDRLDSDGFANVFYEIQRTAGSATEPAVGYALCRDPGLVMSGMTLVIYGTTFEFKRGTWTVGVGNVAVDLTGITTSTAFAAQLAAVIFARNGTGGFNAIAEVGGYLDRIVRILPIVAGSSGNSAITGSALEVLDVVGMVGGAAAGAFVPVGGTQQLRLSGAVTTTDNARLLAYEIGWAEPTLDITRALAKLYLRQTVAGPAGDGAFTGTAVAKLSATGMSGGVGINPAVLSFRITFPRHLTDQELRTAVAVVDGMKRAETHWTYTNPPEVEPFPFWRLNRTLLGRSRLGRSWRGSTPITGSASLDPYGARSLATVLVELDLVVPARSIPLVVGARYAMRADIGCYVRQTNRVGNATTSDRYLPAGFEVEILVGSLREAYVSALAVVPAYSNYLRLTRLDG